MEVARTNDRADTVEKTTRRILRVIYFVCFVQENVKQEEVRNAGKMYCILYGNIHLILRSCKAINMYCFLNEAIHSDESFIVGETVLASRTKTFQIHVS